MKINEDNFIQELKRKNEKALEYAVDAYGNIVYRVVCSVLNSLENSGPIDECVNDIFMSIWNNIDSFDEQKGRFKSWLTAVAKYKAIDYNRKISRQETAEDIDEHKLSSLDNTENIIISHENKKELLSLIHSLKDMDKEIFIRRYFMYEDIDSIAKYFNMSRSSVDTRLSRSRKYLKEKLICLKEEVI